MIALFIANGAMAQWFTQNSGTTNDLRSIFFTDASVGYVVGKYGTILKTTDGGLNWIPQYSGSTTDWYFSVHFPSQDTGYAVGHPYVILKTTNGGVVWTNQNSGTDQDLYSVYFIDANTGYAVGNIAVGGTGGTLGYTACVILKTINGGLDWTVNYSDSSYRFHSVHFPNINTGYVVGYDDGIAGGGYIVKTTDGGANWTAQNLGGAFLNSVFFTSADTGYVVGANIFKTTDGGVNWINQSNLGGDAVYFPSKDTGYAVGYNGTVLKSINEGASWTSQTTGITNKLNSVYFTDSYTGYTVGDNGIILKTTNGGGFPVGVNNQNKDTHNISISPNPASTTLTIEATTKGSLVIHNTSGQQLLLQQITEPTTTIDISGWKSGVYLVKVVDEKGVSVGKFIKQ